MSKRITRLLQRDNYKCGIHAGGCGKTIERKEATRDHIIPKNYVKTRSNNREFIGDWNYQPMHAKCNVKREGQIIDKPDFKCKCHGVYVDEQGARWVMYKEGKTWKMVKYWEDKKDRNYTNPPKQKEVMNTVNMVLGRKGSKTGVVTSGPGVFGHMFYPMGFYARLERNGFELERTEQWDKLEAEAETFAGHYLSDGGASLKWERSDHSVYTVAKFVYWSQKAQSEMAGHKRSGGAMELLKQKVNFDKRGEYPAIKEIVDLCLDGMILVYKETPLPVGGFIINQPSAADKLTHEGLEHLKKGEKDEAEKTLNKVTQKYPRYASGWAMRGQIRTVSGNLEGARRDFTKAIDLQKVSFFYALRAEINRWMGDIKRAQLDIEQALAMDGDSEKDGQKYRGNLVSTETGKPMEREEVIEQWRKIKACILGDERREDYTKLWEDARDYMAEGRWEKVIDKCEEMFEKYKGEGVEKFAERMKEYKDEIRAEFYWMAMMARLSLEKDFVSASCRLAQSISDDGGLAIEQEMAKEIYKIDLDDFLMLTEKVKERISRMINQLVEEGILIKEHSPQKKNIPAKRWQLIRPSHGKD